MFRKYNCPQPLHHYCVRKYYIHDDLLPGVVHLHPDRGSRTKLLSLQTAILLSQHGNTVPVGLRGVVA